MKRFGKASRLGGLGSSGKSAARSASRRARRASRRILSRGAAREFSTASHRLLPSAYLGVAASAMTTSMGRSATIIDAVESRGWSDTFDRSNFHGRQVSLAGGIGMALAALSATGDVRSLGKEGQMSRSAGAAALIATGSGAVAGAIDDIDQGRHDGDTPAKGLSGHFNALTQGRVTTGALKVALIGAGALGAGVLLARGRAVGVAPSGGKNSHPSTLSMATDAVTSAVVIASWANVHNLLDLRPGRALKAAGLLSLPLALTGGRRAKESKTLAWAALGCALGAAPTDLGEDTMLGDTGANALGALVGTAIAAHPSRLLRLAGALGGTGLVLASEKVSFSQVIESTPLLASLDALGRRSEQ